MEAERGGRWVVGGYRLGKRGILGRRTAEVGLLSLALSSPGGGGRRGCEEGAKLEPSNVVSYKLIVGGRRAGCWVRIGRGSAAASGAVIQN